VPVATEPDSSLDGPGRAARDAPPGAERGGADAHRDPLLDNIW